MGKEIVLQKILFPSEDICDEREMYFKGYGFNLDNNTIIFENDGLLTASTYFNSLSLDKWKKYTGIKNLKISFLLKGDFVIRLCSMKLVKGKVETRLLLKEEINVSETTEINLDFDINTTGVVYYELNAKCDGAELFEASYSTCIVDREVNPVNIAIGICTFKREEFIIANLNRLNVALNDTKNVLYGKVKVFVADNGQTLPLNELNNENIHIVYNKNLGGAGGFTRSLIEAKRYSQEEFTNFIFLDDDIVLSVAAIEKEAAFLSLLLPEYRKSVIGGAMFSTDKRYLQFESAAKWERTGFVFNRRDIDLRDSLNILLNEETYDVNYNAWCCCCIPFDIVTEANLPLPIFFHMDDVEYGLRNKLPVITLNGINVWHLYKKQLVNAKNDYYDIRNKLIMLSGVMPDSVIPMAYTYLTSFTNEVLKYHYARAINAFDGILDFLKGFEWFKNLDTQQKHGELYNNVRWQKADDNIRAAAHCSIADGKGKKYKLKVAVKQVLPSLKKQTVVFNENGLSDAAKARSVAVYVPSEGQYILYKKNRKLELKCLYKHYKIARKLKKIQPVIDEYHNRLPEVQSINFWDKYLGLQNNDKRKKVLFVASDNDATSGAFRSMVVLNYILKNEYKLDTCVLLPNGGDGYKLLKEKGLRYTTIETVDWIVTTDSNKR
ncbi:MAG: hypothetical protein LUD27_06740, partial [Clostridia bacterium]|nr:hypothetical protein [Clostridia bacterium]